MSSPRLDYLAEQLEEMAATPTPRERHLPMSDALGCRTVELLWSCRHDDPWVRDLLRHVVRDMRLWRGWFRGI